jgi:hypothetical protein
MDTVYFQLMEMIAFLEQWVPSNWLLQFNPGLFYVREAQPESDGNNQPLANARRKRGMAKFQA